MRCESLMLFVFFFLMIRRPPRSTQSRSSAASDVYKRQSFTLIEILIVIAVVGALSTFVLVGTSSITNKASNCLLYTSPSPRDRTRSRMPSSA